MRSPDIEVTIDLDHIRTTAQEIRDKTRVPLIAVVKADAYGLGAGRVAAALEPIVEEFAYFSIHEARAVGRPGLVVGPAEGDPAQYSGLRVRPGVADSAEARKFAGMRVAVNVDTGMQRFGCSPENLDDLLRHCTAEEMFTHTERLESVELLQSLKQGRSLRLHAAATSLLDHPQAWLDAVRPGLALYRGAVRVTARLVEVRDTIGPVGYTGFTCRRVGVLLGGYSNHLQPAPVLINGRAQRILEAGMNTSFVSVNPSDRAGDEIVLLGDALTEAELAGRLKIRPHEVLCRYTAMGVRRYASIA